MPKVLFLEYPKCSTCQKAKKWLESNGISFIDRHIVEDKPTVEELQSWFRCSGKPLKSFFNTNGLLYKSMALKDKLPQMAETEQLKLLASNGMLIKRPLIISANNVLVGFKEAEWEKNLK